MSPASARPAWPTRSRGRCTRQGGIALYGRCDEESIVPYQPVVEALRLCIAEYTPATLRQQLHGLERDLARVFPELSGRLAEPPPGSADPEAERYRLFEAFATLITGISETQGVLLVLDDLQWADQPTLLLLRHLVRATARAALLIVICFRDVELADDTPVSDFLADLRREPRVARLSLAGLSRDSSGDLVGATVGHDVPDALVHALHGETVGNPFFLEELARHLMETGALPRIETGSGEVDLAALGLPEGVREVVSRRVRRLAPRVSDLLTIAAVVGQEFDADLVGRVSDIPAADGLESLDQAADAGLIRRDPTRMGRYTFAHALTRQSLTASLSAARLAQLHAQVGEAMEAEGGARGSAADLARHFTVAVPLVGPHKAIEYTAQAGRDALANVAFEAAAAAFERALELLDEYAPNETALRVELLTDLAGALVYVDERAGVDAALHAVNVARTDGSPAQFGRAVAVFVEPMYGVVAYPAEVTRLFDEARTVLGDYEPALRARLLAFEAFKYAAFQLTGRDGRALAAEAVGIARTLDDPLTLSDALFARAASFDGAPGAEERVALGEELVRLGDRVGARASAFGLRILAGTALEVGDAAGLSTTITRLERVGTEQQWLPAEVYAAQWRGTQALLEGRFEDARARGDDLRRYARAYRAASSMHIVQTFHLARERGALGNMGPLEETAAQHTHSLLTWGMLALAQLESGDERAAVQVLLRLEEAGFRRDDPEGTSGAALAMLAEVAATAGAVSPAATLYELLSPFAGRLLSMVLGLACLGAADRYLGMLSTVLGRWDAADAHFVRAVALEERIHGDALLPRTRSWHARLMLERGDAAAGRALLTRVVAETSTLGMRHLSAQAEALRST